MFDKVLIANRGAIACRVERTLRRMGVGSVAVYSEADAHSLHVEQADEAVCIGGPPASASYLDMGRVLRVALETGAKAIHPGYGFLSENASFAEACGEHGIAFIGPTPEQLRAFGLKHTARDLAAASGVPLLPGTGLLDDVNLAVARAETIGYPVMLKSTAGGGGIGMQLCHDAGQLRDAFGTVQRLGQNNFANAGLFLEKYVVHARHVEVQVFGDGEGRVIALGERDCSLQRRNQKVLEETPAPDLPDAVRGRLLETAEALGESVGYRSAGTVEYIYDAAGGLFYFLEVNTRLQVEHGVTEEVTGVDLVEWMVRLAAGELPHLDTLRPVSRGHAVQVRLYAEDPGKGFQPSSGLLTHVAFPESGRCDTWVRAGVTVPPYYDPMLAKLIVHAKDREAALAGLAERLDGVTIGGIETNLDYLRQVIRDPVFRSARHSTRYLADFRYAARTVDVLTAGTHTTIQDFPGREGYWDVGVPPSGPMDDLAFRLGNRLLDNDPGAAGLEITVNGPALRFNADTVVALTGAPMTADLDGVPVRFWEVLRVSAGSILRVEKRVGHGARAYLCVQGGFQTPSYLGSRSTFTLGRFGGHGGRALQVGDVLHLAAQAPPAEGRRLAAEAIPEYAATWMVRAVYGPHGAPDFFTPADIETFFGTDWEVHYNSSRTGVRLIGPRPAWARADGGEAGLHPSNIHDNAYAIGTVDFTGDMPVILGPDGPSLGGFVCPATLIRADRWIMGQLSPGDRLRFVPVGLDTARRLEDDQEALIRDLAPVPKRPAVPMPAGSPILREVTATDNPVQVVFRPAGEKYLLVEYGPQVLDINLRFRVHALMLRLRMRAAEGIRELTPGIRSLQVHYDNRVLPTERLLDLLEEEDAGLRNLDNFDVPARMVHLPLAWDDSQTRLAIDKYSQSVRPGAPWCPSNIEFIRRINGLDSVDAVKAIVFDASYLVMGLGDVYLGAPVATPLDPRHRLVTTKYNPARTWTPENAVGIGGSYLCVYGMEGPGGYQFVGRTVQMWNRYLRTPEFTRPWLLRFFDQIRFFPVSEEKLLRIREDFPRGRYRLKIEENTFSLRDYNRFISDHETSIQAFKARQQAAFEAERERWAASGQHTFQDLGSGAIDTESDDLALGKGEVAVEAHVHGSVWEIRVQPGQRVMAGDSLLVLESMKMEIGLGAEHGGRVVRLLCEVGSQVSPGQPLLILDRAMSDGEQS